jgi:hypothetical protein
VRTSRIIINDWLAWGHLVKGWATGDDYFAAGKTCPRPATLDAFRAALLATGAGSIPDWVVDFELMEWNETKLLIQLPSAEAIRNAEAILRLGKPYPLPAFYRQADGELPAADHLKARLALHAMRIGEHAADSFA